MSTEFTVKQPSEAFYVSFDFTDVLGAETISSVTSVIALDQATLTDVSTTVLDSAKQSNTTKIVSAWVRAGTTGHRYIITCKIVGSAGSIYELEGILPVEETPGTGTLTGGGLVLAPTFEPVTLEELKLHLRIDVTVITEDDLLKAIITAAREHIEDICRRALLTQTWDFVIKEWPFCNYIKLPKGNLQTVTSIKWKDTDGVETSLTETTDYLVETNGDQCGRIVLPYSLSWPSGTLYPSNPITIRFICGWTTASLVPWKIKVAIKMLAAKLYESRGDDVIGQTVSEDKVIDRLLVNAKLYDEF
jgi:uncharacterized phiE125 gp8 family phage protein